MLFLFKPSPDNAKSAKQWLAELTPQSNPRISPLRLALKSTTKATT